VALLSRSKWQWTTWGTGTYREHWRKDVFPSLRSSLGWYSRTFQLELLWFAAAEYHADGEVLHSHFLLSERHSLLPLWDLRMQLAHFYRKHYGRIQVQPYLPKTYSKTGIANYLTKYVLKEGRNPSSFRWDIGCYRNGKAVQLHTCDPDPTHI